jgi:hypothetical protein
MQVLTRAGADSATIKAANADFTTSTTIRTALYSAASGTADTGWLRLANGDGFYWRNAAGSGNIRGLKVDSVNRVIVGDSNNAEVLIYPGSTAMVKFDGTTASQPALKVSGASLKVRLADDSADADIYAAQLLTSNTTYVLRTTAALANSAAANTATLTNAPTAGNPTKWVAINDNGTVRYMPLW